VLIPSFSLSYGIVARRKTRTKRAKIKTGIFASLDKVSNRGSRLHAKLSDVVGTWTSYRSPLAKYLSLITGPTTGNVNIDISRNTFFNSLASIEPITQLTEPASAVLILMAVTFASWLVGHRYGVCGGITRLELGAILGPGVS